MRHQHIPLACLPGCYADAEVDMSPRFICRSLDLCSDRHEVICTVGPFDESDESLLAVEVRRYVEEVGNDAHA